MASQYKWDEPILPQLEEKQLKFLEHFTKGIDCKEAMRLAGYSNSYIVKKHRMFLESRVIQLALIEMQQTEEDRLLTLRAQNEAIKQFWVNVMNNKTGNCKMADRLKASENLARVNGLFVEKVEISGNVQHNLNNEQSYEKLTTEQLLALIEATDEKKKEENNIEEVEFEEVKENK